MCQSGLEALRRLGTATCLVVLIVAAAKPVAAQSAPAPDPAGIATGDKASVTDAAGTSFVVSEPTDKSAPDYADKRKAFEEFQALAQKEPLAVKLAPKVEQSPFG